MIEAADIKQIRQDLLLSQEKFAKKLKVDKGTVSRWERGLLRPRLAMIRRIKRLQNHS